MLEMLDTDEKKEIELIASLYWNQFADINIDGSLSDWITQRGSLRIMYAEKIMKVAK